MVLDPSGIITKDYRDRYSVDGSSGCDLVIRHVRLTDAGLFICRAYISSNSVEKTAHLIILGELSYISEKYVVILLF